MLGEWTPSISGVAVPIVDDDDGLVLSMSADLVVGSLEVLGRLDEQLGHDGVELRLVNLHRLPRAMIEKASCASGRFGS